MLIPGVSALPDRVRAVQERTKNDIRRSIYGDLFALAAQSKATDNFNGFFMCPEHLLDIEWSRAEGKFFQTHKCLERVEGILAELTNPDTSANPSIILGITSATLSCLDS